MTVHYRQRGVFHHSIVRKIHKAQNQSSQKGKDTGHKGQIQGKGYPAQGTMRKTPDEKVGQVGPDDGEIKPGLHINGPSWA